MVDIDSPTDATINCVFLPEFSGSARCQVQYGTDPTYVNLPYSAESNKNGTAGDVVCVVLRERLNSSTEYYYTVSSVSGDVTIIVQGNFTTPQYSKYIINMLSHVKEQCILTCAEIYIHYNTEMQVCGKYEHSCCMIISQIAPLRNLGTNQLLVLHS